MAKYTVTALDTTGIQPYIFGSNRLQENIGASELVKLATEQWPLEPDMLPKPNNVIDAKKKALDDRLRIESEDNKLAAEVIYAGGGNTVIIFRSNDEALAFARRLTRKVLKEAPGLSLVVAHEEFDWDNDSLSKVVLHLVGVKLNESKASRLPSMPLLGLGVTAACESTGLVATRTNEGKQGGRKLKLSEDEDTRLISLEIAEKLVARDWANEWLHGLFRDQLRGYFRFPSDIDNLGRMKGEESYVAVVHADGNRMGQRVQEIADDPKNQNDNRAYIIAMRSFSESIEKASIASLKQVVGLLAQSLTRDEDKKSGGWKVAGKIPLEKNFLPFRPLVFGGDDLTFVCNAQIGMSLAAAYLEAFESETKKLNLEDMHACAGIAMVKMHYPFARAYHLSEELSKSAKNLVREKYKGQKDTSALDWHFATSGLSGSLKEIRKLEYVVSKDRTLLMRPLLLRPEDNDQDGRAWSGRIETLITIFQKDDVWSKKRNKVKALREALREGPRKVEVFIRNYGLRELPEIIPGMDSYQSDGYVGARCGYFDAIELYDHYLRLEPAEEI